MQQGILNVSLATMITDTVVAAWHELITPQQASRVRVEYRTFGPNQPVQYLKLWAADAAGQWRPVCNYWTAAEGQRSVQGVAFSAPFYSESFAHLLTALLDNQETYSDVDQQTHGVILQIPLPSDEERAAALAAGKTALTDRGMCDPEPDIDAAA
jgi:hypothetical protein